MIKKAVSALLLLILAGGFSGIVTAAAETVVASNYSDRYHVPSCKVASKIPREELLTFKSPAEAEAAGLSPCKKCHPRAVTSNLSAAMSKVR